MSTQRDTVRQLLPDRYDNIDVAMRRAVEKSEAFKGKRLPDFVWHAIGSEASDAIGRALDQNVFALSALAWCKALGVRKRALESLDEPGKRFSASLGEHPATTRLYPALDVAIEPFGEHRVQFELEMTAKIKSARLTIVDGRIVGIGAGQCNVEVLLKCEGEPLHVPFETREVELGKPFTFDPGLVVVEKRDDRGD